MDDILGSSIRDAPYWFSKAPRLKLPSLSKEEVIINWSQVLLKVRKVVYKTTVKAS